jgi:aspartyl-tRNA(Asn)/glutamyl-tRNA(Gln) amidotransferase subunit B
VPLIEIVTEPEFRSAAQAKNFLKWLTRTLKYLNISDCDMEKGSMRLEANISVKEVKDENSKLKIPQDLPSYKVELKNINSFRYLEKAVEFEIERQMKLLKQHKTPDQETRGYDEDKGITFSQRSKEDAQDYRYFPEPDIPPIKLEQSYIDQLKQQVGESPMQAMTRLVEKQSIRPDYSEIIVNSQASLATFEQVLGQLPKHIDTQEAAKQIINQKLDLTSLKPRQVIKQILAAQKSYDMAETEVKKLADQVLSDNPKEVVTYKAGKPQLIGFFIGQVAKSAKGQADPKLVQQILRKKLD